MANIIRSKAHGTCRHWDCSCRSETRNPNGAAACWKHERAGRELFIFGNHEDGWSWHVELEEIVFEELQTLRRKAFEADIPGGGTRVRDFTPRGARKLETGVQGCIFIGAYINRHLLGAFSRCAASSNLPHPPWLRTVNTIGINVITLEKPHPEQLTEPI